MIKIIFYKVPDGIYLASKNFTYSGREILNKTYAYNGKELSVTHSKNWFFLEGESEIKTIQVSRTPPRELIGFILSNSSLESDTIPLELSKKRVQAEWDDDNYNYWWNNEDYYPLRSLYKEVYHQPDKYFEDIEFEAECLGELDIEPAKYSVDDRYSDPIYPKYEHKGTKGIDLSSIARYDELEEMLTPEFLLCTRPCHLTSKQSYMIIRQYVKDNLDSKMAAITSDYNFCFTVEKKIKIKPYIKTWESKKKNGGSYARPRMHSKEISHIQKKIFEMTQEEECYKNYTPVPGFRGESLADLAENIKLYLEELIHFINAPVSECEHCNGTGHNIEKYENNQKNNKRKSNKNNNLSNKAF